MIIHAPRSMKALIFTGREAPRLDGGIDFPRRT